MSGRKTDQTGLAQARERIGDMVIDLDRTVDEVVRLTESGDTQAALRLIDQQRDALAVFVDGVARDVAADEPRGSMIRPGLRAVLATATVVGIVAGIGFGVLRNSAPGHAVFGTRVVSGVVPVADVLPDTTNVRDPHPGASTLATYSRALRAGRFRGGLVGISLGNLRALKDPRHGRALPGSAGRGARALDRCDRDRMRANAAGCDVRVKPLR